MFIVLEGIDGAGKSTQVELLSRRLRRFHSETVVTQEPGGTPLGDALRDVVKHGRDLAMIPSAELLLFAASRAQLVEMVIRPALTRRVPVLCDRYIYSTVAYQGYGRRLDCDLVRSSIELATGGLQPDIVFFLDVDVRTGLARKHDPFALPEVAGWDRFDSETIEFHQRVRQGYLDQAQADPERWVVLNGSRPLEDLAEQIWTIVEAGLRGQTATA